MMSEMEQLKMVITRQKDEIIEGMREELDRCNEGNYAYQVNGILDEVNKFHERMMEVMNSSMRSSPDPVANPTEFQYFFHIEDNHEDDTNDCFVTFGDNDNQIASVNLPRGITLS
jgi:hypothetical protein